MWFYSRAVLLLRSTCSTCGVLMVALFVLICLHILVQYESFTLKHYIQGASNSPLFKNQKVILCVFVLYPGGEGYRVTAQMVLVCCWRSMKEVAMLLGQLCQSLPLHFTNENSHSHQGLITKEQVRSECDEHTNTNVKTVLDIFLLCDMSTINTIFLQRRTKVFININ